MNVYEKELQNKNGLHHFCNFVPIDMLYLLVFDKQKCPYEE